MRRAFRHCHRRPEHAELEQDPPRSESGDARIEALLAAHGIEGRVVEGLARAGGGTRWDEAEPLCGLTLVRVTGHDVDLHLPVAQNCTAQQPDRPGADDERPGSGLWPHSLDAMDHDRERLHERDLRGTDAGRHLDQARGVDTGEFGKTTIAADAKQCTSRIAAQVPQTAATLGADTALAGGSNCHEPTGLRRAPELVAHDDTRDASGEQVKVAAADPRRGDSDQFSIAFGHIALDDAHGPVVGNRGEHDNDGISAPGLDRWAGSRDRGGRGRGGQDQCRRCRRE